MRTKIVAILSLLLLISTSINAQIDLRKNLSSRKGITIIYLSKSLLRMAPDGVSGNINLKGLNKKIDQLEIYTSENPKDIGFLKFQIDSIAQSPSYEVLMTMREGEEEVTFYVVRASPEVVKKEKQKLRNQYSKDNNDSIDETEVYKEIIMTTIERNDCTIIRIMGFFTTQDIQNISSK